MDTMIRFISVILVVGIAAIIRECMSSFDASNT